MSNRDGWTELSKRQFGASILPFLTSVIFLTGFWVLKTVESRMMLFNFASY